MMNNTFEKVMDLVDNAVEAIAENEVTRSFVEGTMIAAPGCVVAFTVFVCSKNVIRGTIAAAVASIVVTAITDRVISKLDQDSFRWEMHQEIAKIGSGSEA